MSTFNYDDRIYGPTPIAEPVLVDLLNSQSLQRLKGIDQFGYTRVRYGRSMASRLEHSLGVMLLLKKFNAPLEAQLAGLLHDVSHGAFSHSLDYALDAGSQAEQDHQDNILAGFIQKTEIPALLERHGFDVESLLVPMHFPLLETKLPDLCADRLDYSWRDGLYCRELTVEQARAFIADLTVVDQHWAFKTLITARAYAALFVKMNTKHWADFTSGVMHHTTGEYIRYALDHGYVTHDDLYTTDAEVLAKLQPHHAIDQKFQLLFDRLDGKITVENRPQDYDATVICKSRVVDPLCYDGTSLRRLSEIEPGWAQVVAEELKPKQYFLKFER